MPLRKNPVLVDVTESPHARLYPLCFGAVRLEGGFWSRWRTRALPAALRHAHAKLVATGTLANFEIAAGRRAGEYQGKWFADSDLYKWLEAASLYLAIQRDADIEKVVAAAVDLVRGAQMPDGYLNTFFQLKRPAERWKDMAAGHELYCAGHLFQAAVAHLRVTGDLGLFEVARRFADHMTEFLGPGRIETPCGHPEVEMALVEMYRVTREARYLELAQFLVDQRGKGFVSGEPHHQDAWPVREATEIHGHAVRMLYLLSGVTDVYLETGEPALLDSAERLWRSMVGAKTAITGGVGSMPKIRVAGGVDNPYFRGESFTEDYNLPNAVVHNETCAQVASVMWNWRMLLATGDARFADLLERTLYNSVLSGLSLDGTRFFYTNPLASLGNVARSDWFPVACCPPNVLRTLAALNSYVATTSADGVQLHLYDRGEIEAEWQGDAVARIRVETDYPWEGLVRIEVLDSRSGPWELSLRIPAWCSSAHVRVNSRPAQAPTPGTYAVIRRPWKVGDTCELEMDMPPSLLEAHPFVETARNCVAITRGPLVYCLEACDQEKGIEALACRIDCGSPMQAQWRKDLLEGVVAITADGIVEDGSRWKDRLYLPLQESRGGRRARLVAIPYYSWANRAPCQMSVWIPRA